MVANHIADKAQRTKYERALYARSATGNATHLKINSFDMELFFMALADRTRLRLLNLIGRDEVCVYFFVEVLQTNQPKISRHLAYEKLDG